MIAVVVGMHRSGTSTVAGLLHHGGIAMGEEEVFLPRPGPENPRGFFENHRFRLHNDRMAERCGYRVKSWSTEVPVLGPGPLQRRAMERLLRRYAGRYADWGFKDPRTCLTLDPWLRALERTGLRDEARVVFVARDANAVARSLARRDATDPAEGLRLWRIYNERALSVVDAWGVAHHALRYEDLCRDPTGTAAALFRFLGRSGVPQASAAFVAPDLDRSSRAAARPGEGTPDAAVRETARRIAGRVRASRGPEPAPAVPEEDPR